MKYFEVYCENDCGDNESFIIKSNKKPTVKQARILLYDFIKNKEHIYAINECFDKEIINDVENGKLIYFYSGK